MKRSILLAALAVLLWPVLARPGEGETGRRIVYVPEDRMDQVLARHEKGVLLDVREYLDLWRLARQHRIEGAPPPVGAVVLSGLVTGEVGEKRARFTARWTVRALDEGIRRVPFPLGGTAVERAKVDGKPALLSRGPGGDYLLVQGAGDHEAELTLERKVERAEDVRRVNLGSLPGAALTLDLTLPAGMEPVEGTLGGAWRTEEDGGKVRMVAQLPAGTPLDLAYRPRRETGIRSPLLEAAGRSLHRVGARLLHTTAVVEVTVHRKAVREIVLSVPKDVLVTGAEAPDLAGWEVSAGKEAGRVRLAFHHDALGVVPVILALERSLTGPGDVPLPAVHVTGAAGERGVTAVVFEGGVRGRTVRAEGLARIAVPTPPRRNRRAKRPPPPERLVLAGADAAYRYWSARRSLVVRTEVPETRVDCRAAVLLRLLETRRELGVTLEYRVVEGEVFRLTPALPAEYSLAGVRVLTKIPHRWERGPDGTLAVIFPGGVPAGQVVTIQAGLDADSDVWRSAEWEETVLPLPIPDPKATGTVEGRLSVLADPGFRVRDRDLTALRREAVEGTEASGVRLGYSWRGSGASGSVVVTRRPPRVTVVQVAAVSPGVKTARYTGILHYTVKRAGVRRFRFRVSGGFGDRLEVVAPGAAEPVRRPQPDGSDLWEVDLARKVRGEVGIRLSLTEEMQAVGYDERRRAFTLPEVTVLDADDETGYLAVETGLNMEVDVRPGEGLREIGLDEVPPGVTFSRGLLAAYAWTRHPATLSIEALRYEDEPVLNAFAKGAKLVSVVARDGLVRTRATYVLMNTDLQFLKVRLPEASTLWGALVAGKPVKPQDDKEGYLVPLSTTRGGGTVSVVLMIESRRPALSGSGTLRLEAPVLPDVIGAEARWTVWLPSGCRVLGTEGVFAGRAPARGRPFLVRAFEDLFTGVGLAAPGAARSAAESAGTVRVGFSSPWPSNGQDVELEDKEVAGRRVTRKPAAPKAAAKAPPPEAPPTADMPAGAESRAGDEDRRAEGKPAAGLGIGGGAGGKFAPRKRPPPAPARLGRAGGLSLDVPLPAGGTAVRARALGIRGSLAISFAETEGRKSLGLLLSVLTALLGFLLTGALRRGAGRRLAFVVLVGAFGTFGPAWFGARDLTLWDAVARGALWAGVLFLVLGVGRRLVRAPSAATALLLVVLTGSALAGDGRTGDVVYVPYDPAKLGRPGALDEGGKVFLPFTRYRELWNEAHPDRPIDKAAEAPVPWLVTAAGYEGSVEGDTVRLTAAFDLVILAEGWVEVALPLKPAVVAGAEVDGRPARVAARSGSALVMLREKGAHRLVLDLRLLLRKKDGRSRFSTSIPAIPRSRLVFHLPGKDLDVHLTGPVPPRIEGAELTALLGTSGALTLSFGPRTEAPRITARIEAETREVLSVAEGRADFRLRTTFTVVNGSLAEARFGLDRGYELLDVTGPDVKSWSAEKGELVVVLSREVKDRTAIQIRAVRSDGIRARSVPLPAIAPRGVVRERGLLAVGMSPALRSRLDGIRNLDRTPVTAKAFAGLVAPGAPLSSAFRFVLRPLGLTVTTAPLRSKVRAELPVLYLVGKEWLRGRVLLRFRVSGDGAFEFPVAFPADLEVERVAGRGLARWWREGDTLTVSAAGPVRGVFDVEVWFRKRLPPGKVRIDLPAFHARAAEREVGHLLVTRMPGMSVTIVEDRGLVKQDVAIFRSWKKLDPRQVNVYGYRQDGDAFSLAVARTFPEARVRPVSTTRLQVLDDRVVVDTQFSFRIENAGKDVFEVFFPEGEGEDPDIYAPLRRAVEWREAEVEGRPGRILTLTLQREAIESYGFRVVYEKKLVREEGAASGGRAVIRGPEPLGENAASYVLVENQSSGEVTPGRPEGLDPADAATFPYLPAGFDLRLVLAGYRGRAARWTLPLSLAIHTFADFPDALITSAEVTAAVGRDGWTRSRVTYKVLNRSRQFLALSLPEGARLEAVQVNGKAVKPGRRTEGGESLVLVPLTRMRPGDSSDEVVVHYSLHLAGPWSGEDLADVGELRIPEPGIRGLQVEKTFYTVSLPEGYRYRFDGNMDPVVRSTQIAYQLEKDTEEMDRLLEVQTLGNRAQAVRAADNYLRKRAGVEQTIQSARRSLRRDLEVLADEKRLAGLTAGQRKQLRAQVEKSAGEIEKIRRLLGAYDERNAANFARDAALKRQTALLATMGHVKQEDLSRAVDELRKVAEKQVEQGLRFKGKKNVASQTWTANVRPQGQTARAKAPPRNANAGGAGGGGARTRTEAGSSFFTRYLRVEGEEDNGAGGAGGGGFYNWPTGWLSESGGEGGRTVDLGAGESGEAAKMRATRGVTLAPPPAAKAGLLSLPVTVPLREPIYRFEKLNGGARLTVLVDRKGTGRGLGGFLGFLLTVAVVVGFARWRPDRRIPHFGPLVLFLAAILVLILTATWLVPIVAAILAAAWLLLRLKTCKPGVRP